MSARQAETNVLFAGMQRGTQRRENGAAAMMLRAAQREQPRETEQTPLSIFDMARTPASGKTQQTAGTQRQTLSIFDMAKTPPQPTAQPTAQEQATTPVTGRSTAAPQGTGSVTHETQGVSFQQQMAMREAERKKNDAVTALANAATGKGEKQTDYTSAEAQKQKAALKAERDALEREYAELNSRYLYGRIGQDYTTEDVAHLQDMERQLADYSRQIEALQKPMTAGEHLKSAGTAVVLGLERAGLGVANAVDWALGEKSMPWWLANELATMATGKESPLAGKNPVTAFRKHGEGEVAYWQNSAAQKAAGNDTAEAVSKHAASIAQSSPFILMNLMTMGAAGAAAAGATSADLAYTATVNSSPAMQAISTMATEGLRSLASNPTAQYSFVSTFGGSYEEALKDGATEAEATIYAMLNASFGTIVEMGGGDPSLGGMEALPAQVREALAKGDRSLVMDYARSIVGEIGEEELQGILERGLKGGYQETPVYSTENPNAAINPGVMLETAKDTAIDTAILGGGQMAAQAGLNALGNATAKAGGKAPIDAAQILADVATRKEPASGNRQGRDIGAWVLGLTGNTPKETSAPAAVEPLTAQQPQATQERAEAPQEMDEREGITDTAARTESGTTQPHALNSQAETGQNAEDERVSKTAQTIAEAKATPEKRLQSIRDAVADGKFTYVRTSDQALAERAADKVTHDGWQQSLLSWSKDVAAGKANEELAAMGATLLNNAGNSDMSAEQYIDLATDYNALMHRLGRGLAAARILASLSPEGKLYGVQKSVDKINEEAKGKYGVQLPPELIEKYRRQETDAGRDEVISEMQKAIADQIPSTLGDKLTALRYTAMLGNFKTQARNIAGNTAMLAARIVKDRLSAVMEQIGAVLSGGKIERTKSIWAGRQLYAEAWRDFDSVADEAMGEAKYSDSRRQFDKDVQDKRTIFKNNGSWGTDQANSAVGRSRTAKAARAISDLGMAGLEGWRKATNWAMEMGDAVFSRTNYADALAGWLKAHNIKSISDASPEVMERARSYAIKQAQEATFRDTNDFSAWVSSLGRGQTDNKVAKIAGAVGEGIQPFRKTPANVLLRGEEYSPLGIINTAAKAVEALQGKSDVQAADVFDQLGKTLTGTGLSALGYFMAAAGRARGKSDDKDQENFDKLRGAQDYSIVFPGLGSFTVDWLSPSAIPFFMGVAFHDAAADGGLTPQEAWKVLGSITDPVLEMSMLSGVNDALDSVTSYGEDADALPLLLANSLASLLSQFVPTLLGQIEQASEDYRQTTYTSSDSVLPRSIQRYIGKASAKTPGWDYNQADYIDAWGRKQETKQGVEKLLETFFSPGYSSTDRSSPVDDELQRLYDAGQRNVFPEYASRSTKVNGTTLTPDEFERYATTKGQTSLALVQDFVQSEEYQALDDAARADIISNLYAFANDKAKREVAAMRGEYYTNSTWDKTAKAEEEGVSPVDTLLDKKGYSSAQYMEYAQEKQSAGAAFETVEEALLAAFKDRANEYDSKGTYAAVDEVLRSGLTDSQKDALVAGNFAAGQGGFARGYNALRSIGNTPQQATDFFRTVDADGNGAIKQAEIASAFVDDPGRESSLRAIYEAYQYKKTWDEFISGYRK